MRAKATDRQTDTASKPEQNKQRNKRKWEKGGKGITNGSAIRFIPLGEEGELREGERGVGGGGEVGGVAAGRKQGRAIPSPHLLQLPG